MFVKIWTVCNCEFIENFLTLWSLYHLLRIVVILLLLYQHKKQRQESSPIFQLMPFILPRNVCVNSISIHSVEGGFLAGYLIVSSSLAYGGLTAVNSGVQLNRSEWRRIFGLKTCAARFTPLGNYHLVEKNWVLLGIYNTNY